MENRIATDAGESSTQIWRVRGNRARWRRTFRPCAACIAHSEHSDGLAQATPGCFNFCRRRIAAHAHWLDCCGPCFGPRLACSVGDSRHNSVSVTQRLQAAILLNLRKIKTPRRKLRDLHSLSRVNLNLKDGRLDELTHRVFIHGEEIAVHPIPILVVVGIVYADHYFQSRASPKTLAVRRREADIRTEITQFQFAAHAKQNDFRTRFGTGQKIVRFEFKTYPLFAGHLFFDRGRLNPFAARTFSCIARSALWRGNWWRRVLRK